MRREIETRHGGKKAGPHYERRMTSAFAKSAPPGRHTDGGGLYLQVSPSGSRRWVLRIVVQGRRRDYGLGSFPLVGLAEAREKAFQYRRIARDGRDPKRVLARADPKTVDFRSAAKEFHSANVATSNTNGKHIAQWLSTLERYAYPTIGEMPVSEIAADDIAQLLMPIWTEKEETARRVQQRIKAVMQWSIAKGHRSAANPVEGVKYLLPAQKARVRHFNALPWDEVDQLTRKLYSMNGIGVDALLFTLFTVQRSGSTRHATWDQFSEQLDIWTIPEPHMKSRKEFKVPIPMHARDILVGLRSQRSHAVPWVFPSPKKPQQPISENTMAKNLKALYPKATVHGLRSTFRDWAEIFADARNEVVEATLAHINPNKVERAYLRTDYLDERQELLEAWSRAACGATGVYTDLVNQFRLDRSAPID